jgi:hypothetical protein
MIGQAIVLIMSRVAWGKRAILPLRRPSELDGEAVKVLSWG